MNFSLLFLILYAWPTATGFITWIEKRYPLPGTISPPGSPWPMPQSHALYDSLVTLDPEKFTIHTSIEKCDVIDNAIERYKKYIFSEKTNIVSSDLPLLEHVYLFVEDPTCDNSVPKLDDNESYSVIVVSDHNCNHTHDDKAEETHADILAHSIWGALRGLETFAQLVWQKNNSYVINQTTIVDFPRYKHRGILLDTARHFLPISVLKKNLDAMEWNKFNVFHWHIVDDQSFPFESKTFPNLTTEGAYSPKHVYTQDQIRDVMNYARLRGIRVILEFDTPGHTMGFGKAFPQLLTPCYGDGITPGTANYSIPHSDYEILDPTKNFTYDFMTDFFKEVRTVLQDEYIHLGMDEVYYGCWNSSPDIRQFMVENNYTRVNEVEQHYVKLMIKMIKNENFKYITWQDPVENGVTMDDDAIIHVWKDTYLDSSMGKWQDYISDIAKKNYKIIFSSCWYLNYISYGSDWKKYYECDPKDFNGTDAEKELVIGGEACLWGEYVDGTNLLARLWPRASAVAERLWSAETVKNVDDAAYRLDEQRCRMLRRGIPAQPILNGFCGDYEWEMNG